MEKKLKQRVSYFIRNICKGKTEQELIEAEENFMEYLMVVKGISERLTNEGKSTIPFDDTVKES